MGTPLYSGTFWIKINWLPLSCHVCIKLWKSGASMCMYATIPEVILLPVVLILFSATWVLARHLDFENKDIMSNKTPSLKRACGGGGQGRTLFGKKHWVMILALFLEVSFSYHPYSHHYPDLYSEWEAGCLSCGGGNLHLHCDCCNSYLLDRCSDLCGWIPRAVSIDHTP